METKHTPHSKTPTYKLKMFPTRGEGCGGIAMRLFLENQHHIRTLPLTELRLNKFCSVLRILNYSSIYVLCISVEYQNDTTMQTVARDSHYLRSQFCMSFMLFQ